MPVDQMNKEMSVKEAKAYLEKMDGWQAINEVQSILPVLWYLAFERNHMPHKDRVEAQGLLEKFLKFSEVALKKSPEQLKTLRAANEGMKIHVRKYGIGSLFWLLREYNISMRDEEALIAFISRPDYANLLDDFLSDLPSNIVTRIKSLMATRNRAR